MSRQFMVVLISLVLAVIACNAPSGGVSATQVPATAAVTTGTASPSETPMVGDAPPTAYLPTAIIGGDPVFTGPVQFTDNADALIGGFAFAEGIKEIWALWQYANMREGLTVRRVWYLNGEVWIDRTVEWDIATYGASGTVRDVSIYDHDAGLPAGKYELRLYIDGKAQHISPNEGPATFEIVETDLASTVFPSPSGAKRVEIQPPGTLRLLCESEGCEPETLATHAEIIDVDWFPAETHVLYTVIDRSEQFAPPATIGLKWELWIVDLAAKQPYQISEGDERFHDAVISPLGDFIAVAAGTGYGDAGMMDLQLVFVEVADDFQRIGTFYAWELEEFPDDLKYSLFPVAGGEYPLPGKWVGVAEFLAPLSYSGFESYGFNPGVYAINVRVRIADRIADLP